jgi:hypothetical protein
MNKFFITTPEIASALEMATGIRAEKARQQGCEGVTSFWWGVVRHPDGEQAALAIHDAPEAGGVVQQIGENNEIVIGDAPTGSNIVYQNGDLVITTDDLIDELPADWHTADPSADAP